MLYCFYLFLLFWAKMMTRLVFSLKKILDFSTMTFSKSNFFDKKCLLLNDREILLKNFDGQFWLNLLAFVGVNGR